ncbi:MAG TPA: alpha/beta fold hydrolase, partial [Microbacteriaceae bacterium]|nr:alpha/beta fold hydrolase [Microbacteriaceae bacterium]
MRTTRIFVAIAATLIGAASAIVVRFARAIVVPPKRIAPDLTIRAVDRARGRIVLSDAESSRLAGRYGLWFGNDTGYARIGAITNVSDQGIERELLEVVSGTPRAGMRARDSSWFYVTPADVGLVSESVNVRGPLGAMPAWLIRATGDGGDWVIHVHGRTASRSETLRSARVSADAGWTSLCVSYRNDAGASSSDDARYGLGGSEWADVCAAIEFARESGARRIVLFGWSMGALIALRAAAAEQDANQSDIVGIAIESGVLDWSNVFAQHARLAHLPNAVASMAQSLLASRLAPIATGVAEPIDWPALDGGHIVATLGLPVLALHSASDRYVPIGPVRELAALLPETVELHEFDGAGHVRLWN